MFNCFQCFLTYLPIQTAWPEEGWVESIRAVGCHYDFHLGGEGRDDFSCIDRNVNNYFQTQSN